MSLCIDLNVISPKDEEEVPPESGAESKDKDRTEEAEKEKQDESETNEAEEKNPKPEETGSKTEPKVGAGISAEPRFYSCRSERANLKVVLLIIGKGGTREPD